MKNLGIQFYKRLRRKEKKRGGNFFSKLGASVRPFLHQAINFLAPVAERKIKDYASKKIKDGAFILSELMRRKAGGSSLEGINTTPTESVKRNIKKKKIRVKKNLKPKKKKGNPNLFKKKMERDLGSFESSASNEEFASKTDLFSTPPVNKTLQKAFFDELFPGIQVTDNTSIISIHQDPCPYFIDFGQSYVSFDITIKNLNGTNLPPITPPVTTTVRASSTINTVTTAKRQRLTTNTVTTSQTQLQATPFAGVALEQNIGSSLFSDVDLQLSGQSIISLRQNYHWIGYLINLLCFQKDARKTRLEGRGWFDDRRPDTTDFLNLPSGSKTRAEKTNESHIWSIQSPFFLGLALQERYLPPMLSMKFIFHLNDKLKVLKSSITDVEFKYSVSNFKVVLKKIQLVDEVQTAFERSLLRNPALYFYENFVIKEVELLAGVTSKEFSDIFDSIFLPSLSIVWFVSLTKAQGTIDTSIFEAEHFDLNKIYYKQENQKYPTLDYHLDMNSTIKTNSFVDAWLALYPGAQNQDSGLLIDQKAFKENGFAYFLVNFQPENGLFMSKMGNTFLHIAFKTQLAAPVKMYVFSKMPVCLQIDSNRQVFMDYKL